jgi:shikimate kinase
MRGVGQASAAITVVNALSTGVGCAVGIELYASAELTMELTSPDRGMQIAIESGVRTGMVDTAVRTALARYAPGNGATGILTIRSQIPVAKGLKSSSAVASAVVLAVAAAQGSDPTPVEVARLSAEVGRASGVSATGAFDDALAGLSEGFVVTDNREDRLIRSDAAPSDLEVALWVPPEVHTPSPAWRDAFAREVDAGNQAVEAARSGAWPVAMERNTELVERLMGYDYRSLRARLRKSGAVAAGVSGLGPALAALAPSGRLPEVLAELATEPGDHLHVPLRRGALRETGGRRD